MGQYPQKGTGIASHIHRLYSGVRSDAGKQRQVSVVKVVEPCLATSGGIHRAQTDSNLIPVRGRQVPLGDSGTSSEVRQLPRAYLTLTAPPITK
jgi:hypothetical protein